MSRGAPARAPNIGFALVDPPRFDPALIDMFESAHVAVTFYVRPEVLVLESNLWRFVRAAGHELGNGCLLGVTDDGRLPNWTCDTIEAELQDCATLLADLGQERVRSIFLPGRVHLCADGRYRQKLQRAFDVCVGNYTLSNSLGGVRSEFDLLDAPGQMRDRAGVVLSRPNADELRRLLSIWRDWPVGPVSELLDRRPHT